MPLEQVFELIEANDLDSLVELYNRFHFDVNAWDPEYHSETLLFHAVQKHANKIVGFLLYHGANPHMPHPKYNNQTPLDLAKSLTAHSSSKTLLYIWTMLDDTKDANQGLGYFHEVAWEFGFAPPIMTAIRLVDVYAVKYLLEKRGVALNTELIKNETMALALERMPRSEQIVRDLMVHGADIIPLEDSYPHEVQELRSKLWRAYLLARNPWTLGP